MTPLRILLVVNAEWYFWSHRLTLAQALRDTGMEVIVAAAVERDYDHAIRQAGFRFIPIGLKRRSTDVPTELASFSELWRVYRQVQPDLVHHFTIKPVIYGSLAARFANVPYIVNTIPGLGYTFLADTWKRRVVRSAILAAYRVALMSKRLRVIFQNPEDRELFVKHNLIASDRTSVIRGSGVNIDIFHPSPEPNGTPIVLLASRLLWDKGVKEFVESAKIVRDAGVNCRFVLVGIPDAENPNSVPETELRAWHDMGLVEWWGLRNDMPTVLQQATVVTLPSYYPEGVPKILLEAAASARMIITTDTPGCREVVHHNVTGLLVPPRQNSALAESVITALQDSDLRKRLGMAARILVEQEFAESHVIARTLDVYRGLVGSLL